MNNIVSVDDILESGYSPNPEPWTAREFLDVFWVDDLGTTIQPWRLGGCSHHIREFVSAAREIGSQSEFYWFIRAMRFCPVCALIEAGEADPYFTPQAAFAVTGPGQDMEVEKRAS